MILKILKHLKIGLETKEQTSDFHYKKKVLLNSAFTKQMLVLQK